MSLRSRLTHGKVKRPVKAKKPVKRPKKKGALFDGLMPLVIDGTIEFDARGQTGGALVTVKANDGKILFAFNTGSKVREPYLNSVDFYEPFAPLVEKANEYRDQ